MQRIRRSALAISILLGTFSLRTQANAERHLVIIVNRASDTSNLSAESVKAYFLKQHKEWPSGEKVRPVQQESDLHSVFLGKVLGMSSADYERYWLERRYSAAETTPKTVEDDEAVLKFVGAMKGAIGYVDSALLDDKARNKLRVIYVVSY